MAKFTPFLLLLLSSLLPLALAMPKTSGKSAQQSKTVYMIDEENECNRGWMETFEEGVEDEIVVKSHAGLDQNESYGGNGRCSGFVRVRKWHSNNDAHCV